MDEIIDLTMDSSSPESEPEETPESLAESKKNTGNQFYKKKQYMKALPFYNKAIELCPQNASYYGNRAACNIMLSLYNDALRDAKKAIELDPKFVKGYLRVAKCCIALGDLNNANSALLKVQELEPNNEALVSERNNLNTIQKHVEDAQKSFEVKDYRKVVFCMDRALDFAIGCRQYKLLKAECLALLGRYQEAQEIANDILHVDKTNVDAIYVRAMCLYYQDNMELAFTHFQHILKIAPDHQKALEIYKKARALKLTKEEGNEAFKSNDLQRAFKLYSDALQIDPLNTSTNAKLYFNRATVSSKMSQLQQALSDCSEALKLDEGYLKALLRRAKCYNDLGQLEEAVYDYEKACKLDKSRENKRLLQEAKLALKRSKRKDYYKILGIERNASEDDIKKAYRKRALVHHPDRHSNASENEKVQQEKMFKEVGEAYAILSDPKKRARYDSGQDLEEMEGMGSGWSDFDACGRFFAGGPAFNIRDGFDGFTFQFG